MTYYEQLVQHVERSMNQHPASTIVMDSDTFEILATAKNPKTLARRMKKAKRAQGTPVIFQRIKDNGVWALTRQIP